MFSEQQGFCTGLRIITSVRVLCLSYSCNSQRPSRAMFGSRRGV
jgi:hypothetical protein